jgi:6-methylsalicylate decarboxylase
MAAPRRVDVHFHLIPPFYREAVYAAGRGPAIGKYPDWTPQLALDLMDACSVEVALTSLAQPGVGFGDEVSAQVLARRCNDYAAELVARWPARFGAFGTVPMWSIKGALDEVAYALDVVEFDGVSLFASYGENFLGDARFDPVLAMLNERGAVVFVHPGLHPSSKGLALPWPAFMMEYLFDTTRAVVNLIFSGAIERFPRIRFILPHAGGLVPYFAWRLSVSPMIDARFRASRFTPVSSISGTTTRFRRESRPSAHSITSPCRSASCSAPTFRSPIRASSRK